MTLLRALGETYQTKAELLDKQGKTAEALIARRTSLKYKNDGDPWVYDKHLRK
jgi:hypothetical protein